MGDETRSARTSAAFPPVTGGTPLTDPEQQRYGRQVLLPELDVAGQLRLKGARVAVIGAGGLGAPVLIYLAAAGIGRIHLVDDDTVDLTNLHRQVLYTERDIGRPKVDVAAKRLRELNPNVQVVAHRARIDPDNALDLLADCDLVVDGTDNFATRYLVNDACVLLGLPYVWGSVFRFDGQVSVFWAERGPHYRDLYPEPPPPGLVPSCAEGGVLGVLCAIIGATMAAEAVKLASGVGEPLLGRLLVLDALTMQWRSFPVEARPETRRVSSLDECDYAAWCAGPAAATDASAGITVDELRAELSRGQQPAALLVDVRQPAEHALGSIPGSTLRPAASVTPEWIRALDQDPGSIVLFCRSGARSQACVSRLEADGVPGVRTLLGGIDAWFGSAAAVTPTARAHGGSAAK